MLNTSTQHQPRKYFGEIAIQFTLEADYNYKDTGF